MLHRIKRQEAQEFLEETGFVVELANNGKEALELSKARTFAAEALHTSSQALDTHISLRAESLSRLRRFW